MLFADLNDLVEIDGFHSPRLEMFLDEGPVPSPQPIRLSALHDNDVRKEVLARNDMKSRYLDEIESDNSFFACLSKIVFGTEVHATVMQDKILNEIRNNAIYTELICDAMEDHAIGVNVDLSKAKSNVGDIHLFAAATFLQVDIYVLRLDAESSFWDLYEKLRIVPSPSTIPTKRSTCGSFVDYYITMFEDHKQHYWRIVPNDNRCNCQTQPPCTVGGVAHTHNGKYIGYYNIQAK